MRILIVEDMLIVQEFLKMMLEPYGECVVVENGEDGVDEFRKSFEYGRPYSVILMDVILPGMTGYEALRTIRSFELDRGLEEKVKIIVTSALDADDEEALDFSDDNAVSFVPKPVRDGQIVEAIRAFGLI